MKETIRTVRDSHTISSKLLFPEHMNNEGILYGGQHLMWIDELAGIVAKRHCGDSKQHVTTACIEKVDFYKPCYQNDIINMEGYITYVGNSSMEICVDTYTEHKNNDRQLVNRAYLILVALDENKRPVKAPGLELISEQDKRNWDEGKQRSELRKAALNRENVGSNG